MTGSGVQADVASQLKVSERTTCRSCNAPSLTSLFSLGNQYVSNFVDAAHEGCRVPLEVVLCDVALGGCGLLQLRYTVPREWLYRKYWYRSGVTDTMRTALAGIAQRAERLVALAPRDIVLDIGCNDGTLLRSYTIPHVRRVGFEPAENLLAEAHVGTHTVVNDFFRWARFAEEFPQTKVKIITTIAMFYDVDDLDEFTEDIAQCLDKDGIWVIQMSYLPSMLSRNAFDNICHEHLTYFSLFALRPLFNRHGLEITDGELNDANGGSLCVYVRHQDSPAGRFPSQAVRDLVRQEQECGLHTRAVYEVFAQCIAETRRQLQGFIQQAVRRGKTVYVYGASTKGNTLLQYCGLDHRWITAAAERSPEKWGKKTVGTLIPIISEEEARAAKPDYFLALPWHFLEEFIQRERVFLQSGGQFIVPLPRPNLVSIRAGTLIREELSERQGQAG